LAAFEVFFGPDITTSYIDSNSTNAVLVDNLDILFTVVSEAAASGGAMQALEGLFALPFLLFQQNWLNPSLPYFPPPNQIIQGLSSEFYVSVDLSHSNARAIIPLWTIIIYAIVSLLIYFWFVGCMAVSLFHEGPSATLFNTIDLVSRTVSNHKDDSLHDLLTKTSIGNTKNVQEELKDQSLFLRNIWEFEGTKEVLKRSEFVWNKSAKL